MSTYLKVQPMTEEEIRKSDQACGVGPTPEDMTLVRALYPTVILYVRKQDLVEVAER